MPEGIEAEMYRLTTEEVVDRTIRAVEIDDRQGFAAEIRSSLPGRTITAVGRHGKHIWLDLDEPVGGRQVSSSSSSSSTGRDSARLGIHFGMSGRLMVDGSAPIPELAYSSPRWEPRWHRLIIHFEPDIEAGALIVNDPRRWARFVLDPDLSDLGPDLFEVSASQLAEGLRGRSGAIKSVLLNQRVVAGLGNLCVDELLLGASVRPTRSAGELTADEVERLSITLSELAPRLLASGGSHTGLLNPDRRKMLGACPVCGGAPLLRDTVAGRTTVWCSGHQD